MQRRQRDVPFKFCEYLAVHQNRLIVVGTAVHDAVPDRNRFDVVGRSQPGSGRKKSGRHVGDVLGSNCPVDHGRSVGGSGPQPGA